MGDNRLLLYLKKESGSVRWGTLTSAKIAPESNLCSILSKKKKKHELRSSFPSLTFPLDWIIKSCMVVSQTEL